jgi:predicted transcriptional regulator
MRNDAQIQGALRKLRNVSKFSRKHGIPARTIWRVLTEGKARKSTMARIDAALNAEKGATA